MLLEHWIKRMNLLELKLQYTLHFCIGYPKALLIVQLYLQTFWATLNFTIRDVCIYSK